MDDSGNFRGRRSSRYLTRRRAIGYGGAALGALALTACGGSQSASSGTSTAPAAATVASTSASTATAKASVSAAAGAPQRGGTLHVCYYANADPPNLDPMLNRSFATQGFSGFIYSRLFRFKTGPGISPSSYQVEGDLVASWEQPDATTLTLKLKPDAKWQSKPPVNGRALVAADVAYSYKRFTTEPKNVFPHALGPVSSLETPDDHTVTFKFSTPFVPIVTLLAEFYLAIMPHEVIEQYGDASQPEHAIGTGPFMLRKYERGVSFTFDRNPTYHDAPKPYVDTVVNHIIPDPATQVAQFRSGSVDLFSPSRSDLSALQSSNPNMGAVQYLSDGLNWFYFDVSKPPFSDLRVRQAMYKAIDRDGMLKVWYDGKGKWDTSLSAGLSDWWLDPTGTAFGQNASLFKLDPKGAQQLLSAAGHGGGLTAPMYYVSTAYGQLYVQIAETVVAPSLKQGGFDVQLKPTEYNTYIATVDQGQTGKGFVFGFNIGFLEPDEALWNAYDPSGGHNVSHVNDSQLTSMIAKQRGEVDAASRKQEIDGIQRYIAGKAYYPPGVTGQTNIAYQPKVQNLNWKGDYLWASDVLPNAWLKS